MIEAQQNIDIQAALQTDAASRAKALQQAARDRNMKQIDEAARDFEAVFVTEMLRPMFESIEVNSLFGGGRGEEVFRGLMLDEYGKIIAGNGGVGIAGHVKAEMIRIQEATSHEQ